VKNRSRTSSTWFSVCPVSQPDTGVQETGSTQANGHPPAHLGDAVLAPQPIQHDATLGGRFRGQGFLAHLRFFVITTSQKSSVIEYVKVISKVLAGNMRII
jgi:hypothetical protein